MGPGMKAGRADIRPGEHVIDPPLPKSLRVRLPTQGRDTIGELEMDRVLADCGLLKAAHTDRRNMFTCGDASPEKIRAGARTAVLRQADTVLTAVSVAHQGADFGVCSEGDGDREGAVFQSP